MYEVLGLWFDARLVPIYYDAFNRNVIGEWVLCAIFVQCPPDNSNHSFM